MLSPLKFPLIFVGTTQFYLIFSGKFASRNSYFQELDIQSTDHEFPPKTPRRSPQSLLVQAQFSL